MDQGDGDRVRGATGSANESAAAGELDVVGLDDDDDLGAWSGPVEGDVADGVDDGDGDSVSSFLRRVRHRVEAESSAKPLTGLVTVEFVGVLPDGDWVWIGAGCCGVVQLTVEALEGVELAPGLTVRARVEGWPWDGRIVATAPGTARRPGENGAVGGATDVLVLGASHWVDQLRKGDLVVARVPYSPHSLPGRRGRLHKTRPAVFVRRSGDFAVVRGIYTADRGRHVVRHGAIILRNVDVLPDPVVAVKNRDVEIPVAWLAKRLGRLSESNLGRLGLGGASVVPKRPDPGAATKPTGVGKRPVGKQVPAPQPPPNKHRLPDADARYLQYFLRWSSPSNWDGVITQILHDTLERRAFPDRFDNDGVPLEEVAALLKAISRERRTLGTPPKQLHSRILGVRFYQPSLETIGVRAVTDSRGVVRWILHRRPGPTP